MAANVVLQNVAGSYEQYQKKSIATKAFNNRGFLLVWHRGIFKIQKYELLMVCISLIWSANMAKLASKFNIG